MQSKTGGKITIVLFTALLLFLMSFAPVFAESDEVPDENSEPQSAENETIPTLEMVVFEESTVDQVLESQPSDEEVFSTGDPLSLEEMQSDQPDNSSFETETVSSFPEEETLLQDSLETPPIEEPDSVEIVVDETGTIPEALADADLSLAGADGETLDMVSTENAELLESADPYFTVGTQTYRWLPLGGDCAPYIDAGDICIVSAGDTPIQDAINYIQANGTIPTDRKIYVEAGSYNGGAYINGGNPNLSTLQGLIGVDGSENITLDGDVSIFNLTNGFTLSGFTIINGGVEVIGTSGTVTFEDLKVENAVGNGIYVHANTNSHIKISDVTSSGNFGYGARIDVDDSGLAYNVTIKNSYFDDNGSGGAIEGLAIYTSGKIFMDSVSASRNNGSGIYISSEFASLSIKNAVMAGNDAVPDSPGMGYGFFVFNTRNANITLENIYVLNTQDQPAVWINSGGNITIKNTQVLNNSAMGMQLNNASGTGSVKVYDSNFNDNGDSGLNIASKGVVYLSSVSASNNTDNGLYIDNCQVDSGACTGVGTVTITSPRTAGLTGVNTYNNNGLWGLNINSGRAILLTNIIANANGYDGIKLDNQLGTGGIKLVKNIPSNQYFTFYNSACENSDSGIEVISSGTIFIDYLIATNNAWRGGDFQNDIITSSPSVTVRYSTFNDNDNSGLFIESSGNISLTNVSASNNNAGSHYGAHLYTLSGTSGGVSIVGKNGYVCQFNSNGSRGLNIYARGNVTLNNVEVNDNGLGTYIDNWDTTYPKKVTITNTTFFSAGFGYGVEIYSKGSISLNTVNASDNDRGGALLDNTHGTANIQVKNSQFNNNSYAASWQSLYIDTYRNVTLYSIIASGNGYTAVEIDNCQTDGFNCLGKGTVSVTSKRGTYNTFVDNNHMGLNIWANGNVILSNIIASGNSTGLQVDNDDVGATGNVTLSASNGMRNIFENNGSAGISIGSNGAVSIRSTDSFNNDSYGAYIDTDSAPSAKSVTIKESTFIKNKGSGLDIKSLGTITLQGVDSSDNSMFTGTLDIVNGTWRRDVLSATFEPDSWTFTADATHNSYNVTLNSEYFDAYLELYGPDGGLIDFDDSSGTGGGIDDAAFSGSGLAPGDYTIVVSSTDGMGSGKYDLVLNGGTTVYSQVSYGARLDNNPGTGDVKILYLSKMGFGAQFRNNNYGGVYIESNGTVSITRVEAFYNANYGIHVYNESDAEKPVTITNATAIGTSSSGFYIQSRGNVSFKNVFSYNNAGDGAYIQNSNSLSNRYVKITAGEFIENKGIGGIYVLSNGNVILSNVICDNPGALYGAAIDNRSGTGYVSISGKKNAFNNHANDGLYIKSHGKISLSNFNAFNNGGVGVSANNGYTGYGIVDIFITNTQNKSFNYIVGNNSYGLYLFSLGNISLNKVYTEGNSGSSYVYNYGSTEIKKISVANSVFSYTSSGNGLDIEAHGPVYLTNVQCVENFGIGASIWNNNTLGQDVIIKNTTVSGNLTYGIDIRSAGLVNIDKLYAFGNGNVNDSGAYIDNRYGDEGITIRRSNIYNNTGRGLWMYTDGPVLLHTTTVAHNSDVGIWLQGVNTDISVTLYRVNSIFNYRHGISLDNVASVSVTLTNGIGNGAGLNGDGLYVIGNGSTIVTISKSVFMGNYGSGVDLQSTDIPTITSSFIFLNDVDGGVDQDLWVH